MKWNRRTYQTIFVIIVFIAIFYLAYKTNLGMP